MCTANPQAFGLIFHLAVSLLSPEYQSPVANTPPPPLEQVTKGVKKVTRNAVEDKKGSSSLTTAERALPSSGCCKKSNATQIELILLTHSSK